jgi:hypothetical protein
MKVEKEMAMRIWEEAKMAGTRAGNVLALDSWYPCGFAWVNIPAKGRGLAWINALKKAGIAGGINSHLEISKDPYCGGYTYWISEHGQEMTRKERHAEVVKQVLSTHGIKCRTRSRID